MQPFPYPSLSFCISTSVRKRFFPLESRVRGKQGSEQGCWCWRLQRTWAGRAGGIFLFPVGIPTNLNVAVRTAQEIHKLSLWNLPKYALRDPCALSSILCLLCLTHLVLRVHPAVLDPRSYTIIGIFAGPVPSSSPWQLEFYPNSAWSMRPFPSQTCVLFGTSVTSGSRQSRKGNGLETRPGSNATQSNRVRASVLTVSICQMTERWNEWVFLRKKLFWTSTYFFFSLFWEGY